MAIDLDIEQEESKIVVVSGQIVIDHNHPLHMHPSDTSGSFSLGIQLIRIENYTLWSQAMEVPLLIRNKLGFVDGSITGDSYGAQFVHNWDRCNAIV